MLKAMISISAKKLRNVRRITKYVREETLVLRRSLRPLKETVPHPKASVQLHMVSRTRFAFHHAVVGKAVRALLSYGSVGSFRRCVFERGYR
jgi:hypothetical protein